MNHASVVNARSTFKLDLEPAKQEETTKSGSPLELWRSSYQVNIAKRTDVNPILKFLEKNYFCKEPLSKNLNIAYLFPDTAIESFLKQSLQDGMTIVARSSSRENQIMGLCINRKSCRWDGDHLEQMAKGAGTLNSKILMNIWALLAREPAVNDYLDELCVFNMAFVSVEKSPQSHGLATELTRRSLALGRDLNYKFARFDCTSEFTKNIAEKLGMERLWDVPYQNILSDDDKTPLILPETPHTHAAVYYTNLKTMPDDLDDLAPIAVKSKEIQSKSTEQQQSH